MTPTARSLRLLRQAGYVAAVVERRLSIPGRPVTVDLFGFADLLAFYPRQRVFLLVQTTSLPNLSSRLAKVRSRPETAQWLQAGGAVEVHGWVKRSGTWRVKRVAVTGADLVATTIVAPPRRQGGRGHRQRELWS